MSSKIVYICDCCEKEINGGRDNLGIRVNIDWDFRRDDNIGDRHLCKDCLKKIENLISDIKRGRA